MNKPIRCQPAEAMDERYSLDIPGCLFFNGIGEPVIIKNISPFGTLLEGRYFPDIGERVELIATGLDVTGTVIWHGPDKCGLLLSREVEPEVIDRIRPAPAPS